MDIFLDNTIAYGRKYPFRDVGHIDPDSYLADLIWEQATLTDLGRELNGLMGVKYSSYYSSIPNLEVILAKTEGLLRLLNNQ